jgi:hypothetical protein
MYSANGILPEQFNFEVPRKVHSMVYSSCPSRGLELLLDMWSDIKEKYKDAELNVYYGFENYIRGNREYPNRMKWVEMMQEKLKQPGIKFHGRVGHLEIAKAMKEADIWAYPCIFPEISCCTGDTLIEMPRDHKKHPEGVPIKELVGKSNFPVYSYDNETDSIVLGTVKWVAQTKKDAEIWRLTLDDGTYLEATSDHKIMTRDGKYKELKDLVHGESLMPVYDRANFMIKQNNGKWIDEHRMVGEWLAGRKLSPNEHVNHLDDSRYDNTPEMLEVMSASEHHSKTHTGKVKSSQEKEKQKKTYGEWLKSDIGKKTISETGTKRANKFWNETFPSWTKEVQQDFIQRRVNTRLYNHKVVSVENTGRKEDVYDMEVDKYHNFGANGIIIHNCITAMKAQIGGAVPVVIPTAAVDETVKFGYKTKLTDLGEENREEYKQLLLKALGEKHDRNEMIEYGKTCTWKKIAEQWTLDLK